MNEHGDLSLLETSTYVNMQVGLSICRFQKHSKKSVFCHVSIKCIVDADEDWQIFKIFLWCALCVCDDSSGLQKANTIKYVSSRTYVHCSSTHITYE